MNIEVYLSLKCSSQPQLEANLTEALRQEGVSAAVRLERLDEEQAAARGLPGSPTVMIAGEALQPVTGSGFA